MPRTHPSRLHRALRLIVITDRRLSAPRPLEETVVAALDAGTPVIQLREKKLPPRETLNAARRLRKLTREKGALLFINDRLDIALRSQADGVHLGPEDLPVESARRVVPPDFIIGYSADDPVEARRAVEAGANYIGCGTVFSTGTKEDAGEAIGVEGLTRVVRAVSVPVVGIGGIEVHRAAEVMSSGAAGVAVAQAVMAAPSPRQAAHRLLAHVDT